MASVVWHEAKALLAQLDEQSVVQLRNCRLLRTVTPPHEFVREDLFMRNGRVVDARQLFYTEKRMPDVRVDCEGLILCPGFIDVQINGAVGVDFSTPADERQVHQGLRKVGKLLYSHGVTSFCPTMVTSTPEVYRKVIPSLALLPATDEGAATLGAHIEGPFIAVKGAHKEAYMRKSLEGGMDTVRDVLGNDLENVKIMTIAPELSGALATIPALCASGIVVSAGHSNAHVHEAEAAWNVGCRYITHLFNAMLPFHHRDPGLIGLLAPADRAVHYSIIVDGVHTHPAAVKIAYRTNSEGCVLITDAICAMGLSSGSYKLGEMEIEIDTETHKATLSHNGTLAGSIATMIECVRKLRLYASCSTAEALVCASVHPARVLGVFPERGALLDGSHADFVLVDDDLNVRATFAAGKQVYCSVSN